MEEDKKKKKDESKYRKRKEEAWHSILQDFETYKSQNLIRDLWLEGIPEAIRGKVWIRVTGNSNSITKALFETMMERGEKLRKVLYKRDQLQN